LVGFFFLCWPIKFFLFFFSSSLPYLAVDVVVVSAEYGNENYEKKKARTLILSFKVRSEFQAF